MRAGGGGSATLESGEEAAARLWRAGSWRRQRGYGGRGVGCSAVLEGGEEALVDHCQPKRRVRRLKRRSCIYVRLYLARAAPGPREYECRQILIMPEGIISYTFTFTYIALVICLYYVNKYKFNLFT